MLEITNITVEEVFAYREIYYEYVKPMLKNKKSSDEIDLCIKYFAPEFGITIERFYELVIIDVLQRLSKLNYSDLFVKTQEQIIPLKNINVLDLPELKCPKRTEQI